jgi:hypothetical protein
MQPFGPKADPVDVVQSRIQPVLPGVMPRRILGENPPAVRREKRMDERPSISLRVLDNERMRLTGTMHFDPIP